MSKDIAQKMTYQEREQLKTFADKCASSGDIQSLQNTLILIAHWMRQGQEISFTEYASNWTAAQAGREDGNQSTREMMSEWPLTGEQKIAPGYSDYIAGKKK